MTLVGMNLKKQTSSEWSLLGGFGIFANWLCALALVAALSSTLPAQSFYGSIVGTVADASGAAVPGATVTITNVGTNEKHSMQSGATGDYRFVNLIPATYRVEVQAANFKRSVRDGIVVAVDSTPRVDVALQVGAATETVEVTTQAPLLQTDSGSIGSQVEGKTVQEMPLNGRNTMNLIALVPGVVPEGSTTGSTSMNGSNGTHTNNAGWSNYAIGGNIAGQGANYLDGTPMNMLGGNLLGFVPTQDVVQEFKVATNAPSAEFGRFGGGVVEMTTKSGANAWHGSAYEYLRNKVLNANNFFSNRTATTINGVSYAKTPRPEWNQNQFGVVLSGPIKRDKAFFLFSWEKFSARLGIPASIFTPTADMQNGIFRGEDLVDPTGNCAIQYDGTDSTIPSSCFDSTAKVIQGWFPAPNASLSGGLNYYTVPVVGNDNDQYNARVDYDISSKQRFFARYLYMKMNDISQDDFHSYNGWKTGNGFSQYPAQQGVLGDTYTFNPKTILDVRLSYLRQYTDNLPPSLGTDESKLNGTNSTAWSTLGKQMTFNLLPQLNFIGSHSIYSMYAMDNLSFSWLDSYVLSGSLIRIVGNHTLKFGGEVRLLDNSSIAISANNINDASGYFDFDAYSAEFYTHDEWANFLLGYVSDAQIATANKAASYNYYQGYYLEDTWEATRKLTVNAGIRWELPGGVAERNDRNTVALPDVTDPVTGAYGTLGLVNSSLWSPRTSQKPKHDLFAPRLGVAYRLTDATVLRAAYGINYLPPDLSAGILASSSPVNMASTSWVNPAGSYAVKYRLSNPFQNGINQATGRSNFGTFMTNELGQSISSVVPTDKYPYQQQWNFSVARQLKGDMMIEVGYAGATASHLPGALGIDELSTANIATINTGISNGTFASESAAEAWGYANRPHPAYLNFTNTVALYGSTTFNALQARVEKRFKSAGLIAGSYTWQKMLGNTDNWNTDLQPGTSWGVLQNYNNLKGEKSILSYNIPQRLVIDYVLNLPFGKGQRYLANAHGTIGRLVSGWSANGITTFQSGVPLSIVDAGGNYLTSNLGAGTLRPNYTTGCSKTTSGGPIARVNAGKWFNTACFKDPDDFEFGNEPRIDGTLAQQGIDNWDFTMSKSTAVTESTNINFRVEFYNIFNRVQFGAPGTSTIPSGWGATAFGAITSTENNPRLIQGALRFNF